MSDTCMLAYMLKIDISNVGTFNSKYVNGVHFGFYDKL